VDEMGVGYQDVFFNERFINIAVVNENKDKTVSESATENGHLTRTSAHNAEFLLPNPIHLATVY